MHFGTCSHGIGDTTRIGMPVIWRVGSHQNPIGIKQGIEFFNLIRSNQMAFRTGKFQHALNILKPIDLVLFNRKTDRTASVPACRLTGFFFENLIQFRTVSMNLGHVQASNKMWYQSCGMPRRAGCQLSFLNQHHIIPTFFGQMIKQTDAHGASTDDHHSCVGFHKLLLGVKKFTHASYSCNHPFAASSS